MNEFKRNILRTSIIEDGPGPDPEPGITYSYRRDGSQVPENPSFHVPTVDYIDVDGNPQTFYADPLTDICGFFIGQSIVNINYCLECE